MSGHNKWSKIKHKKAATDAEKSRVFSKHARLIMMESQKVNGDVNSPQLKTVIEKAKKDNMPQDNIKRAVSKGVGTNIEQIEEVTYEVYGPGGSALIISGVTDNKNRTAAEIKHILSQKNLSLAQPGAALWAFEKKDGKWEAKTKIHLNDEDGDTLKDVLDLLEDHVDVKSVYTNVD
ncbi:YebC/PmpR family DNA-binding transcriptional regulator [Patescibacteria group bacterium]|nr:YebC/PmpR family DNA-binding transcriptional regulator [Patescibacteria group bacterium]